MDQWVKILATQIWWPKFNLWNPGKSCVWWQTSKPVPLQLHGRKRQENLQKTHVCAMYISYGSEEKSKYMIQIARQLRWVFLERIPRYSRLRRRHVLPAYLSMKDACDENGDDSSGWVNEGMALTGRSRRVFLTKEGQSCPPPALLWCHMLRGRKYLVQNKQVKKKNLRDKKYMKGYQRLQKLMSFLLQIFPKHLFTNRETRTKGVGVESQNPNRYFSFWSTCYVSVNVLEVFLRDLT